MINLDIFTAEFRTWLKGIVRNPPEDGANILAVKFSPMFSILIAATICLSLERFSYLTLGLILSVTVVVCGLVAYRWPKLIFLAMYPLTISQHDVIDPIIDRLYDRSKRR